MNDQIRDQYNSIYSSEDNIFDDVPVDVVTRLFKYIASGSVLDVGGGVGRNALYLAKRGYDVSIFDISEVGIDKLNLSAKEKGLNISTKVVDITKEGIGNMYDAIINTSVLHHIDTESTKKIIGDMQSHTNIGGVNIIVTFSDNGDLYERAKKSGRFYPSEEIMREIYSEWKIKELYSYKTISLAKDKKGERMRNNLVAIIAIKN